MLGPSGVGARAEIERLETSVRRHGHSSCNQALTRRLRKAVEIWLVIGFVSSRQQHDRTIRTIRARKLFHQELRAVRAFHQAQQLLCFFPATKPRPGEPLGPGQLTVPKFEFAICRNHHHGWFEKPERTLIIAARNYQEVSVATCWCTFRIQYFEVHCVHSGLSSQEAHRVQV